ncbi:MAG TPA: hypothetical protein PKA41_04610 [Verrucomicrobiota bacterium]|nr:hypothetical protein [Verrucomicrobiota bacterium]
MNRSPLQRLCITGLLLAVLAIFSGCATQEPENASVRPWNAPKSWEGSIPGGMMEGR